MRSHVRSRIYTPVAASVERDPPRLLWQRARVRSALDSTTRNGPTERPESPSGHFASRGCEVTDLWMSSMVSNPVRSNVEA
ncbi:hypothetical protein C8Q77DRAFT_419503 [Trametes polyzona]|nr:hypothetical protein C8Q77DRAFT_419503 [Trametes polyzona]